MGERRWMATVALPLAWIYGAVVGLWRWWRLRICRPKQISIPVVSVGNLTTGGTGKGPVVRWVVGVLRSFGATPVIALRGYRSGEAGSDEALEHARLLPDVAVAVGADRAESIHAAQERSPSIDSAVLDDGFQHWRLARDLDLVLIDATRSGLDEPMLPAGSRREAVASLARAHAVIVTRAERIDPALAAGIERAHGRPPIAWCRHAWSGLLLHRPGAEPLPAPTSWLSGKRVGVIAGIGNPSAFFDQISAAVGMPGSAQWLLRARDHGHFDMARWADLHARANSIGLDAMVTTMKDWVKLEPLFRAGGIGSRVPVVVPLVELVFVAGEQALREKLRACWSRAASADE